ncbi:hypothetical protein HYO62_02390 [Aerococcaceae bacterium DSM 111022]|nr:hypothetical protein [Aerococcaceae bacterium DSM 111022]
MLTHSKTKNEKVVLGLLSYTYTESSPNNEEQKSYLDNIRDNENMDILLYKEEVDNNNIGIVVIEKIFKTDESSIPDSIMIHRVGVMPSFREEGRGYDMFCELKGMFPNSTIIAGVSTMDLIANWSAKYLENN